MDLLALIVAGGFASYRVTQLIVWDSLLEGFRLRVEAWHADGIRPGKTNRTRTFFRTLLRCPYCVGFHASWLTVLTYLLTTDINPVGSFRAFLTFGMTSFAVAGVQALLNRWDDTRNPNTQEG